MINRDPLSILKHTHTDTIVMKSDNRVLTEKVFGQYRSNDHLTDDRLLERDRDRNRTSVLVAYSDSLHRLTADYEVIRRECHAAVFFPLNREQYQHQRDRWIARAVIANDDNTCIRITPFFNLFCSHYGFMFVFFCSRTTRRQFTLFNMIVGMGRKRKELA